MDTTVGDIQEVIPHTACSTMKCQYCSKEFSTGDVDMTVPDAAKRFRMARERLKRALQLHEKKCGRRMRGE